MINKNILEKQNKIKTYMAQMGFEPASLEKKANVG